MLAMQYLKPRWNCAVDTCTQSIKWIQTSVPPPHPHSESEHVRTSHDSTRTGHSRQVMTFYQWTLPKVQPDFQIYVKGNLHGMISGYENYQRSSFTVFSWWYAQSLFILDLRKIGGALVSGWIFPYSYTGLHNERWTEEGSALQTGCVRITLRIW